MNEEIIIIIDLFNHVVIEPHITPNNTYVITCHGLGLLSVKIIKNSVAIKNPEKNPIKK